MKVTNWRKRICRTLVAAGMLSPAAAYAVDIPLGDPSFEAYVVPTTGPSAGYAYASEYRPTSAWVGNPDDAAGPLDGGPGDSNWIYNASYAEGATKRGAPRTGNQAIHGRAHYSGQEVAQVFEAGKTYTFSLYAQGHSNTGIDNPNAGWDSRVWLYIYDGNLAFFEPDALQFARYSPAGDALNRNDFINRPASSTAAQSRALWQKISISHTVHEAAPEIGSPIGVAFWAGFDATIDDASLSVDTTILTLEVNTTNGAVRIVNQTGRPVSLDYYDIASDAGSLNEAGWNSLQNQNLAGFPAGNGSGNGWEEAGGANDLALGESFLKGNSQLASAGAVNLGNAFDVGGFQDLLFHYAEAKPELEADFNANGVVEGSDFLSWQRGLGSFGAGVTTASGNANTDLTVNAQDLAIWEEQYGNTTVPSDPGTLVRGHVRYVTSFAAAIPEPSSALIAAWSVVGAMAFRKR
jgi:hypothetical protein